MTKKIGTLELSTEQRKSLAKRITSLTGTAQEPPSGMNAHRWKKVRLGHVFTLDASEVRAIADCIPGCLYSLGLSNDPVV